MLALLLSADSLQRTLLLVAGINVLMAVELGCGTGWGIGCMAWLTLVMV